MTQNVTSTSRPRLQDKARSCIKRLEETEHPENCLKEFHFFQLKLSIENMHIFLIFHSACFNQFLGSYLLFFCKMTLSVIENTLFKC